VTPASASEIVSQVVALRRVREALRAPEERRRLATVIRQLRRRLGVGVPKRQAAAVLGVTVQALDRWVAAGKIPVVRRVSSSRELIDTEALLALAAEAERLRELGERRVLARAIASLEERERLPRRLRPNQSAQELRYEFLHSTPAGRLQQAVELSHVGAALAANARARGKAQAER
jgi:DNA-directed RNA polymerase specialized sigma subunit